MQHLQTSAPSAFPVTLQEAKDHCSVTSNDLDADFTRKIGAATRFIERETNRQLVTASWTLTLPGFPAMGDRMSPDGSIRLYRSPVSAITSIYYLNTSGVSTLLASTVYVLDKSDNDPRVKLAADQEWPDTLNQSNAVTIIYVAGYGTYTAVPEDYKEAILRVVESLFVFRSDEVTGTIVNNVALDVQRILAGDNGACIV